MFSIFRTYGNGKKTMDIIRWASLLPITLLLFYGMMYIIYLVKHNEILLANWENIMFDIGMSCATAFTVVILAAFIAPRHKQVTSAIIAGLFGVIYAVALSIAGHPIIDQLSFIGFTSGTFFAAIVYMLFHHLFEFKHAFR